MAQPLGPVSAGQGGWTHATPAEAGFAPDLEARLDKAVADKRVDFSYLGEDKGTFYFS